MSVASELTAMADKIRTLCDTDESMGLTKMNSHLASMQQEVSAQQTLIAEIAAKLSVYTDDTEV